MEIDNESRVGLKWTEPELVVMFTIAHQMYTANPNTTPADIVPYIKGRNVGGVRDMLLHGLRAQNYGICGSYYDEESQTKIVAKVNRFRKVLFVTGFDIPAKHITVHYAEIRPMSGPKWADTTHRRNRKKPLEVNTVVPLKLGTNWRAILTKVKEADVPIDELVRSANFYRGINDMSPVKTGAIKRFMSCFKKDGTPSKGYPNGPPSWFKDYLDDLAQFLAERTINANSNR